MARAKTTTEPKIRANVNGIGSLSRWYMCVKAFLYTGTHSPTHLYVNHSVKRAKKMRSEHQRIFLFLCFPFFCSKFCFSCVQQQQTEIYSIWHIYIYTERLVFHIQIKSIFCSLTVFSVVCSTTYRERERGELFSLAQSFVRRFFFLFQFLFYAVCIFHYAIQVARWRHHNIIHIQSLTTQRRRRLLLLLLLYGRVS